MKKRTRRKRRIGFKEANIRELMRLNPKLSRQKAEALFNQMNLKETK